MNTAINKAELVLEQECPGMSPAAVLLIGKVFGKAAVQKAASELVADGSTHEVDVDLHVEGMLSRGKASARKPTSRALRKVTLALLVRRMGLQRAAALKLLAEVLVEAHALDADAEALLLAEHPEVEEAFSEVDRMVDKLPKIPVQGRVTAKSVVVEVK